MASFFRPQHYYNVPEPNFQGLFRLIDDFDRYSGQSSTAGASKARPSFFTPKFDMTESETAYELHGELPGISKEDVHMEFTDPQTLQIRGRVERTRTEGNPPAGLLENNKSADNTKAITEQSAAAADDHAETASNHSHHATVEDDPEESGAVTSSNSTPQDTPATTVAETVKPSTPARQQEKPGHKYYLVERNVGSFSRSFNFPSRVDNEAVRASLDNGILSVTVPKAPKHQTGRRIAIN
ncbi:hsp20-like protein [Pestalotiopsis sp. NC0098]|nr:hsp20-like protein [Pestalotiopsis sp. NC0098]